MRYAATVIAALTMTAPATAGRFLPHKQGMTLQEKISYFTRSLHHERQALAWLHSKRAPQTMQLYSERAFFRAAVRWHTALLAQYTAKLVPQHRVPGWFWNQAMCVHNGEGSWTAQTGNGFYGGLQFMWSTWANAGGTGNPALASPEEQVYRAWVVVSRDGSWREWPNTARACGLVTAQYDIMDRVGVLLLLRAGLRQAELRGVRVRDVNLVEKYVLVARGKGGKPRRVPIKGELVRALDELMLTDVEGLTRPRTRDEYLLCPKRNGRTLDRVPGRPMSKRGAHEWWYRCLRRAGVVDEGVTSGRRMHAARHTYATDLGRATNWNLVAVQKNLGHASMRTTADIYTHFAFDDQADAVAALPELGDED